MQRDSRTGCTLEGLIRAAGIEPPRIHDVSEVLLTEKARLPLAIQPQIDALAEGSRTLGRDRELAFSGAEPGVTNPHPAARDTAAPARSRRP
jgi:hypothetical protein